MLFEEIVSKFNNVKRKGNSIMASCPCHKDNKPSLSLSFSEGKTLIYCHAGCRTEDIVDAVGLEMTDLFVEGKKNKTAKSWRDSLGSDVEALYDYGDYYKVRYKNKKILYGYVQNNNFEWGMPAGVQKTMYNIEKVKNAIKNGYPVYICEGEKDVDTLTKIGYSACTMGGTGDWNKRYAEYFKGADVVLLPDNDEPGKKVMDTIKKDLKYYAHRIRVVKTSEAPHGDVTDWFNEGHTKEELKDLINETNESTYAPWCKVSDDKCIGINSDLLCEAIYKTMDYIIVKQQGLDVESIYIFKDGIYKKCSKSDFKLEVKKYIGYGFTTDSVLNNVYNLTLCADKRCEINDMNKDEHLINFKNGVLNLKTMELEKHNPKYLQTRQINSNYNANAEVPEIWLKFIDDLANGREDIKNILQECMGVLISNMKVYRLKKCFILYSPLGNTGKSVFLRVLRDLIGTNEAINIPIQKMSDRFALSDLCGKRLCLVGDQTADEIEDSSGFKQLTGGDAVKIEYKGKQSFDWIFDGGIIISCNALPYFKDDKGGHIFERLCIIPCEKVIPKEERDSGLSFKLGKELEGIAKWAIDGLVRLKANDFKLSTSDLTENAIEEFRKRSDTLYNFISENYEIVEDTGERVPKKEFEDRYINWCNENEFNPVNRKNIKERVKAIGIGFIKSYGYYYYMGIRPILFKEIEGNEELPEGF